MLIEKPQTNPLRYDPSGAKWVMLQHLQGFWSALKVYVRYNLTGKPW